MLQNCVTLTETYQKKMETEKSETTILTQKYFFVYCLYLYPAVSLSHSLFFPSLNAYFRKETIMPGFYRK